MKTENTTTHDYAQYGCGWSAPKDWLNFDCSPTLRFERIPIIGRLYQKNAHRFPENVQYGDVIKGLPIAPNSCTGIYCSHVLEHFALEEFHIALEHTFSYLKPGGTFRFVLPDLEQLAKDYINASDNSAALRFMEKTGLGGKRRARGLGGFFVEWIGGSRHFWLWDEKSMAEQLRQHGFIDIRRATFGDAEDKAFNAAEDKGRFDGCLAMQCKKGG